MTGIENICIVDAVREGSFAIHMCLGDESDLAGALSSAIGDRRSLIVSTPTVSELYATGITERLIEAGHVAFLFVRPFNERSKQLKAVEEICEEYYRRELDRRSVLIAIGGGVCSDLVTVAAAWIRRGLSHIRVPTTLIGQIDAAVGVKGAVNFKEKKSALGVFYPPEHVFVHPAFLHSVPRSHLSAGLAEVVKIALVSDAGLFELLQRHGRELLESSFASKQEVAADLLRTAAIRMIEHLKPNLYENKTLRRLVDFGHTFSPLLESRSHFTLLHGEAVAIDIALSAIIAERLGMVNQVDCAVILDLLQMLDLPTSCELLDYRTALASLEDAGRHRGGRINLVLPVGIGRAVIVEDLDQVCSVLEDSIALHSQLTRAA